MPLPEIPHRVLEAVKRSSDRRGKFAAQYVHASDRSRRLSPPSFPLDLDALHGAGEGDRARIASQARDILEGKLVLLGQRWPVGARTDWALDPVSGSHWDWDRLCFDIDRRLGGGPGDVQSLGAVSTTAPAGSRTGRVSIQQRSRPDSMP